MERTTSAAGKLAALLRTGIIVGVIVAGMAYPLAALAGLGAKAGIEKVRELPRELTVPPNAQTSYVYAADGKTLITMFYEEHRKPLALSDISRHVQHAIIAAEDARFYEHNGVDMKGAARAFVANQRAGGVSQGASTLTMQYVRMALRDGAESPVQALAATEQTTGRKLREMRLAMEVEKRMSKEQILEGYLNSAYFGHRAYGIGAAAEVFFSKDAGSLTVAEAALLAGLVKAPSAYDPAGRDQEAAIARRDYVIDRMTQAGHLSARQARKEKAAPIELKLTNPPNDCLAVPERVNDWGFFCDYFKNWWMQQAAFGKDPAERLDRLRRGGYHIVTTLDPAVQADAQRHVLDKEGTRSRYAHGTVAVEPGSGHVRAMAVNRVYSLDKRDNGRHSDARLRRAGLLGTYPNTVNPLLGGGDMPGYQAGSTFKLFTMLAALDEGLPLSTSYYAPERLKTKYPADWNDPTRCGDRWCVRNASTSMTGRKNMWSGFGQSVNTYFVQLEQKVGAQRAVRMAERLGLRWRTEIDRVQASPERARGWGAFTLGVADTTPLEMANAYATVAAEGRYCEPLPVLSVTGPDGRPATRTVNGAPVEVARSRCHQAIPVEVARAATDAARCTTGSSDGGRCGGWSTAGGVRGTVDRPVAGKSGTTDNYQASWFVGYVPQLAVAAFLADPDNPQHRVGTEHSYKSRTTVAETLRDAMRDQPVKRFTAPSEQLMYGADRDSGRDSDSDSGSGRE
ncbi:transglycosylase domain-containing protein [Catenuloplanes atrovinosus]|uniref:Membrane peptidoglycan carboxypeptidase n=1 Tax=Catenuloplanes atrovinosus TaxID=137266 RepID=A0AAE3YRQ8_9ACTN|nr:transglycosylase domain-containing protein [Catenuloplanes atrovinosus]MDR7278768.1 membrane peptidoglycan carboxypeptidase [Catenuloplanes atrovinosus]